ncbi:MAG: DUF2516 family protein [Dermatophilaceae bacterium]
MLSSAQGLLLLGLGVLAVGAEVFALVDAARHRPDAFVAAGKRTKVFWVALLAVAAAVGVITVRAVLGLFGVAAFVAAAVYLADVRPALRQVTGRGGRSGPYGPW